MKRRKIFSSALVILTSLSLLTACGNEAERGSAANGDSIELLNVSYDPTRELYQEFNEQFSNYWEQEKGQEVVIKQSHGGSGDYF